MNNPLPFDHRNKRNKKKPLLLRCVLNILARNSRRRQSCTNIFTTGKEFLYAVITYILTYE